MGSAVVSLGPSNFLLASAQQCRDAALKSCEPYTSKLVNLAEKLESMAGMKSNAERTNPPPGWPD
jgi:hypothetical protein